MKSTPGLCEKLETSGFTGDCDEFQDKHQSNIIDHLSDGKTSEALCKFLELCD
jgi:hypothetical protein